METTGKILIVDDDELLQSTMGLVFTEENYSVETAGTGERCIEVVAGEDRPDLILLDLGLPDMNGIDVLREIRTHARAYQLPVIINSGQTNTDLIVEALGAGANDFIIKPADTNVIVARARVAMKLSRGTRELLDQTRHQVMHETIGAACHHVAQPMTALQTGLELFINEIPQDQNYERKKLTELLHWARETSDIIHKLQNVHAYKTVAYYGESKILDIQTPEHPNPERTLASP